MIIFKNRFINFLVIISAVFLTEFVFFETAYSANNTEIIIDENLKPGMVLKDAFELLGPPEQIDISDSGTVVIPYDSLGLSIEIIDGGTVIDKIHTNSSFKGRFASEVENNKIPDSEPVKNIEVTKTIPEEVQEEVREEVKEELREELREEVKKELREEVLEEVNKEVAEEFNVFDLYGFNVKTSSKGVVISEIKPASVAESGGLKVGEPIRKAAYKGASARNIYYVSGLEAILKRAIIKRKKSVYILQDNNQYYKVEVPKRK